MNPVHTNCLICSSEILVKRKEFVRTDLLQCKTCGFVFCKKIPSQHELTTYYANYGLDQYLSPITVKRYHEWLDVFESFKQTGNILDVGCANGLFLSEAKKRGWNVYGSEYGDAQVAFCRSKGIEMHQGPLNSEAFGKISFDVIVSIEVIEHINNPIDELNHFQRLLRSGGILYCTTPNFNALSRYWLQDEYNIINYPEHLSYYTKRTFHQLLCKSGFEKMKIETTGFSLTRFNGSTGRKKQQVVSAQSDDEILRNKIESRAYLRLAKSITNFLLNLTGLGSSLKATYIKQ